LAIKVLATNTPPGQDHDRVAGHAYLGEEPLWKYTRNGSAPPPQTTHPGHHPRRRMARRNSNRQWIPYGTALLVEAFLHQRLNP